MRRADHPVLGLACAVIVALTVTPALAQKRVALVIGNAAYKEAPLKNPVNDARAMAAKLRQVGFEVIQRENAGKSQIESALRAFGDALSGGAIGLFFYAGHGLQVNGRNFLVPVDATIASEQHVRLEAIDVDLVLDQMEAAKSGVNLVILDACRNNPFERRFRSSGNGLAQINAPQGTLIAYATAPGKVASDGDGANGLYTAKLLQHLATPGLPVEEVFKRARVDVARATNNGQTPWESSSLTGSFFFVEPPQQPSVEALLWRSIADSTDPEVLRSYLAQYPNGAFAAPARTRIAAIERQRTEDQRRRDEEADRARAQALAAASAPPTITPQQALWDAIKDATNPALFQTYLERFPNGAHAPAATAKLAALQPKPATAARPAPLQQAAAPAAAPARIAPAGLDGVWIGTGGGWTVELSVGGGAISGTAVSVELTGRAGSRWSLAGRVDEAGNISGNMSAAQAWHGVGSLAGRLPVLEIGGANRASITLHRKDGLPVGTLPAAASTGAVAMRDGKWAGKGGGWDVRVDISGDRLSGIARNQDTVAPWTVTARIHPGAGAISGLATTTADAHRIGASCTIGGRFPVVEFIGCGTAGNVALAPTP